MSTIRKELEQLSRGEIPESMDYSIPQKDDETPLIAYKTVTPEFYVQVFDPELINMFPSLMDLVMEAYEKNKHRTPLQEMIEREEKSLYTLDQDESKSTETV